eukprot:8416785-Pyramimonas_sp.AAC.1
MTRALSYDPTEGRKGGGSDHRRVSDHRRASDAYVSLSALRRSLDDPKRDGITQDPAGMNQAIDLFGPANPPLGYRIHP